MAITSIAGARLRLPERGPPGTGVAPPVASAPEVIAGVNNTKIVSPAGLRTHQEGFGDRPSWYGITFNGVTDDDAGWTDAITALNAGETKSLFLPYGTSIINTLLPAITADDVTIAGLGKSSRMQIPASGSGNLSTFFTLGDATHWPARFSLSGLVFQCMNTASLNASSGHAIYLRGSNKSIIENVEVINTAGFIRCGDGTLDETHGICADTVVKNAEGIVWMDAGVSIYHFERMNGTLFDTCSVNGNLNPVAVPATFAGIKFIPVGGEECDGNVIRSLTINFFASGVARPVLLIDATNGAVDNTRFADCTLDLSTAPVCHIRCDAGAISTAQVTRLSFTNSRLTPSVVGDNVNPALKIENTGNRPIYNVKLTNCVLGMACGPAVEIIGTAGSQQTSVFIENSLFNDRANGAGSAKPCVTTNVGPISVRNCSIEPAVVGELVEVSYMLALTGNVSRYDCSGNDASRVTNGVVDVTALPVTIAGGQRSRDNMGVVGRGDAVRRLTTTGTTQTTLAQQTLPNGVFYVSAIVVGYEAAGPNSAAYRLEALFEVTAGVATAIAPAVSYIGEDVAGWDAVLNASGALARVRVTGGAGTVVWTLAEFDVRAG